jgi:hypothetical protein
MLPPRLLRRVVLAPLVIALAIALVVLSPLIALLTVTFSLASHRPAACVGSDCCSRSSG